MTKSFSADGRQVLVCTDGRSEFWDAEDHLFTVPHIVSEQAAEMYLQVYDTGRQHGEVYGRVRLQYDLREILGIKP